ncbi:MAG: hypothetical protein DRP64_15895 [Verrucomicrobia bacterium]|nr:MAG: hypothetical protein DRP64_15895 [Verrucomicrobiota bacterium]
MRRAIVAVFLLCLWSGIAVADAGWQRDGRSLLTNFNNMYSPCVVETGGEYRFKMWFFGWATATANPDIPGADAIYHARSKNLESWEVYCRDGSWDTAMDPTMWWPVLHASERWYEACHVGDPSVVLKEGTFYMAYSASSNPNARKDTSVQGEAAMICCIMGATSSDGIHWSKAEQPLLMETEEAQQATDISGHFVNFLRPSLRWEGGRWRMWFDYLFEGKNICMAYAENAGDFMREGGFNIAETGEQ